MWHTFTRIRIYGVHVVSWFTVVQRVARVSKRLREEEQLQNERLARERAGAFY